MDPTRLPLLPARRLLWSWPGLALGFALAASLHAQIGDSTPHYPADWNEGPAYRPVVICFPPVPPPLDRPVSHVPTPMPARFTPPAELANYINEPFYAPLSTWLLERALTDKMRSRLDAFHTAKYAALADLRAALEQNRDAAPAARCRALEAFARQQTPQLVALERDAEELRSDLATSTYDWRSQRQWTLGEKSRRGDSPAEIGATLRAYAYYQSVLSPAQRRMLREIALEVAVAAHDLTAAEAAQPFLFFLPEPARVQLPDDLPDALAAKVAAYQTKSSALKKELYDTVYKQDGATLSLMRNLALRSLADKQSAGFAELDTLAEDIRRGLAELPSPTKHEEHASLPPVITERLNALTEAGIALNKETVAKIETVRMSTARQSIQVTYSIDSSGLQFNVVPVFSGRSSPDYRTQHDQRVQETKDQMTLIASDFGRRFADLVNESVAIRHDAAVALGNANQRDVDAALLAAKSAAALKPDEEAFREYRVAVFEPGLSPEQRRLLFGGALEKLDLPLLRGSYQPIYRSANW